MKNGYVRKPLVQLGDTPEECWQWLGTVNKRTGYAKKQWHRRSESAHRWIWQLLFGPIPEGKVLNHTCGNRSCVNPHHLELVTQAENCQHGAGAQLTAQQIVEIKAARKNKKWGDGAKLARQYGVSTALIHDIWNGRAWANIEEAA